MTLSPSPADERTTPSAIVGSYDTATWHWRGWEIRYADQGSGPPLVLLHGFGACLDHWRKNIPALANGGYRVLALDLLGFGQSAKPDTDYSLELWEEMVMDFWRDRVGDEPAVWTGNSIGALLALMLAANHPEATAGTVLLNAAGGLNHRPEELNPPLRLVMGAFASAVNTPVVGPLLFDFVRQKSRIRGTLKQVYGNQEAVTPELVDLLYGPSCDPGAYRVFANILKAPPGPLPAELLPAVRCPMLVMWGEDDPWTPIAGADPYRAMADSSDRVQFLPIAATGHCPHDERPETVNGAIAAWLSAALAPAA